MIVRKLVRQVLSSSVNSALSFILTYFIIKLSGIELYGQLYIVLGYVSILSLINIILPPSYSIIKLQDDESFRGIFLAFYLNATIAIIFLSYFFVHIQDLTFWLIPYVATTSVINMLDVIYQKKGRLDIYYNLLTVGTVVKLVVIYILHKLFVNDINLGDIIMAYWFSQMALIIFSVKILDLDCNKIILNLKRANIFEPAKYIYKNISVLKGYYLLSIFKRLSDSLPAIFFSGFVSVYSMGMFALYFKCLTFGLTIIKNLESLLLNRILSKELDEVRNIKLISTVISQAFMVCFGSIYLFFMDSFSLERIIYMSLLIYPLSYFMIQRSRLIREYKPNFVSKSIIFSLLLTVALCFPLQFAIHESWFVFLTYGILVSLQSIYIYSIRDK